MKIDRQTTGERAREAGVSFDGLQLAFVKLGAGRTDLALFNLETKKSEIVYSPPLQARISAPTYISSEEIIFSERDSKGREVLKKYSLASKQVQEVLPEFTDTRFPRMTSRGLIFSSYRNGTGNVYLASTDLSSAQPLTHTPTLISSASLDTFRNELYYSELTTNGLQVRHVAVADSTKLPAELPKISPLLEDRYPLVQSEVPVFEKPAAEDYSAWPYLLPSYWLPSFYFSNERTVFGGTIAGSDPLEKHAYNLTAIYDSEPNDVSYTFMYANNQTEATVLAKAFDFENSVYGTRIQFRHQLYEVDALWEITPVSDLFAGVGYRWMGRRFRTTHTESMGPSLLASYSDIVMSGAQISPESGQTMNFSATHYFAGPGDNREDFNSYNLSAQKYFSKWLPRRHALLVRAQGQFIDRNFQSIQSRLAHSDMTLSYAPFSNTASPAFIMRGYLDGQFLGKSMANYTLEYRFPIMNVYKGSGTTPLFLKRVHGALFVDGISLDGYSMNLERGGYEAVELWKSFWSTGAEIKLDLTLGYHFPLTLFMGYYIPHDSRYRDGQQFVIGIQL